MYAILFRTLLLYILITVVIRAMGKRQVGELEMSELVTTLLLSQIASLPIEDPEIPLPYAVLPVLLIVAIEIVITFLKGRVNFLKRFFESKPSILIKRGVIDQRELLRMRLTIGELLSEIRQQGYRDPSDIDYAILEENGKFSLIPKAESEPPTRGESGLCGKEPGCALPLIADGVIDHDNLRLMKREEGWLLAVCRERGVAPDGVFLLTLDDAGSVTLIRKEEKK